LLVDPDVPLQYLLVSLGSPSGWITPGWQFSCGMTA
jgi:hypothetical protein